jgi:CheY-like chemotaxis protein
VVLVIDDEPVIRRTLRAAFTDAGLLVEEAADGLEGLEQVRRRMPALILVDLLMPGMDGVQFIATCRAATASQGVPIILMSSDHTLRRARKELPATGVVLLVTKPFDLDELVNVVVRLVNLGGG